MIKRMLLKLEKLGKRIRTVPFLFVLIFLLFMPLKANAADIWTLDFESAGAYVPGITEVSDGLTDYWGTIFNDAGDLDVYDVDHVYINETSGLVFNGILGSYFFGGMDTDGDQPVIPSSITVSNIDISGYTDLVFYVYIAEDDPASLSWDSNNYVHIQYSMDGGDWTNLIWVESSSTIINQSPKIDTDFDGLGDGTILTDTFVEFNKAIAETGSSIDIKVDFYLDEGNVDIAIDNLRIAGTFVAGDETPPCAISDLTALRGNDDGEITLKWTAPGDDGTTNDVSGGTYKIRASTYDITSSNFGSITQNSFYTYAIDKSTTYTTWGGEHSYTMTGLYCGTTYYFAIKLEDEASNPASWSTTVFNSSRTAEAQDLKPEVILNLAAAAYSVTQINLTWTEPTGEPDLDYYKFYRDSTTPYDFGDAYTFTVDTGNASKEDTGLVTGVTYYYRVETFDCGDGADGLFSVVLSSAYSNVDSAYPYTSPFTAPDMMIAYSSGTLNYCWEREVAAGTTYWLSASTAPTMASKIQHIVFKESPTEDERILAISNNSGDLWISTWVAGSWSNSATNLETNIGLTPDNYRFFDVAYEDQSGEALICYAKGEAGDVNKIYFRTWDGSSFSAENSTPLPKVTANNLYPYWLRMERKPGFDEISLIAITSDGTDREVVALTWDGDIWESNKVLETEDLPIENYEGIGVAYTSGTVKAYFCWSSGTVIESITWDGDNWGDEVNVITADPGGQGSQIRFINLKANTTGQLMLVWVDEDSNINKVRFDGSNWVDAAQLDSTGETAANPIVDAVWESASGHEGHCIIVYGDGENCAYEQWDCSTRLEGPTIIEGSLDATVVRLDRLLDGDIWVTFYEREAAGLEKIRAALWQGSAWSGITTIEDEPAVTSSPYMRVFCASPKETSAPPGVVEDSTAPAAISDLTALEGSNGGEVRLKWTAPGDDGTITNISGGAYKIKYSSVASITESHFDSPPASYTVTTINISTDTTPGDEHNWVITGLLEGTSYWFAMITEDGDSNWAVWNSSQDVSTVNLLAYSCPKDSAPASITNLSALTGSGAGEVDLTWSVPGDDGWTGAITGGKYRIRYATIASVDWTTASSEWTDFDDKYELELDTDTNAAGEVHGRTMTSLHGGVTYYFRIKTGDEKPNWSALSNSATTWAQVYIPPANVKFVTVNLSTATLSWDIQSSADSYILWASTMSNFTPVESSSGTANIDLSTLTVSGLYPNTTYYFRVGNLFSGTTKWMEEPSYLSTSTLANPVSSPQIYGVFSSSVTLNWAAHPQNPSSSTCEGYIVQASTGSDFIPIEKSSSTTGYSVSTLTVVGLNSDTTYWFRVGAYNWSDVANYAVAGSTMFPSGAGTGTAGFAYSDSPQEIENTSVDERLTITGDGEFTITGVSVTIPSGWGWSGSASDIALSGEGFNPAPDVSVNGNVVTIGTTTSASITAVDVGTITFTNLTPPASAGSAATNKFTVGTKGTGGFSEISSSPGILVYGKISLGTDGSYNPPEGDGITPSSECLIAAFTLTTQGEGIEISSFSVHFTAVNGATFGTDFTSFKIYRESNATPDGWYSGSGDEVLDESAKTMTAASDYVYVPDQNRNLGAGGTTTYYLTVQTNDETELKVQEGISVSIDVGSVTVQGGTSILYFKNTGSFTGNEIIRGGVAEPTYELTLRLGLDRHSFYDGSLYWAFFINSSRNVVYSTSTNGVNWGGEIKVNDSATGLSSMGIYEDGTYIWVTYTKGTNSYVRKITISTKAMGDEKEFTGGDSTDGHNHSQTIKDSGGFLWRKGEQQ